MKGDCQKETILKLGRKRPVDLRKASYLLNILYISDLGKLGQIGLFWVYFFHLSEECFSRYTQKVCSFTPVPVGLAQSF